MELTYAQKQQRERSIMLENISRALVNGRIYGVRPVKIDDGTDDVKQLIITLHGDDVGRIGAGRTNWSDNHYSYRLRSPHMPYNRQQGAAVKCTKEQRKALAIVAEYMRGDTAEERAEKRFKADDVRRELADKRSSAWRNKQAAMYLLTNDRQMTAKYFAENGELPESTAGAYLALDRANRQITEYNAAIEARRLEILSHEQPAELVTTE